MVPVLALSAGILSSLHCVGMCGGLVMASTKNKRDQVIYQLGRFLGYCSLSIIAASFGLTLSLLKNPMISTTLAIFLGLALCLFGLKNFFKLDFLPKLQLYQKAFRILTQPSLKNILHPSFIVGLGSAFLPCGVLWGVILALATTNSPLKAALGIVFFFLGTIPALTFPAWGLQKVLRPWAPRFQHIFGIFFVTLGLLTIMMKVTPHAPAPGQKPGQESKHSCH